MITVIIPALNEEKTVGFVIETAKKSANVSEIIVVDDHSDRQHRMLLFSNSHGCKGNYKYKEDAINSDEKMV